MAKMPARVMEKFNDLSAIKFMATVDKHGMQTWFSFLP